MSQIMVSSTGEGFYYAHNHNCRRRPLIREMTDTPEEVQLKLAAAASKHLHRLEGKTPRQVYDAFYSSQFCSVRLAKEGNAPARGGFIVLLGELVALHHIDHGKGDWMMADAIHHGARTLTCFDIPHLLKLYERHGFRERPGRVDNTNPDGPAIVSMYLPGAN